MTKAADTKLTIIQRAADVFNQQGYAGSSMADIMQATGLKKGGIYNHFASKDELAIAAFQFAVHQVSRRYIQILKDHQGAIARLKAVVHTFVANLDNPPIQGGCPLLNTAIESDDTHPLLRQQVQRAMDAWRKLIHRIVDTGVAAGEIKPEVQADTVATLLISTLEGALMLSQLYGDRVHIQRAQEHLNDYIDRLQQS
ncbi:MAG: TetR/AcrR family transcriptional regulator [Leptolyngbya sp. DLM2.Bin15]|nr:MAG: TetR/AcrR family transcriptional regulator [Leptolyngbya sp. DLM2.Bin15]